MVVAVAVPLGVGVGDPVGVAVGVAVGLPEGVAVVATVTVATANDSWHLLVSAAFGRLLGTFGATGCCLS